MSTSRRDNFSVSVIKTLERRVNGRCSNPDHRVPTSGPTDHPNRANNIGVAAHITAASPGGARYDSSLTAEQRKDINNGIWLCQNCSVKIDRDPGKYSVELLNQWKRDAEQAALDELGNVPISRKRYEALQAVVMKDLPSNNIRGAVSTICQLTEKAIEELDPRFKADLSYFAGTTVFRLTPKENISFSATITENYVDEFNRKFRDLLDHGRDLEIESCAIKIAGSPVFSLCDGKNGVLKLSTNSRRVAITKASVFNPTNNLEIALDDVIGEVVGGRKSVTFSGRTFQDIVQLEYCILLSQDETQGATSSLMLNFMPWVGKSLLSLPYFDKIYRCYEAVLKGGNFRWKTEIEGTEIVSAEDANFKDQEGFLEIYALLRYIRNARALLRLIGKDALFRDEITIPSKEMEQVERAYCLLFEYKNLRGSDIGPVKFDLVPFHEEGQEPESMLVDLVSGKESAIKFEQEIAEPLIIFGEHITLPRAVYSYSNMRSRLGPEGMTIAPGQQISLELFPSDDCEVSIELLGVAETGKDSARP